jgi:trimeric autotransporter adhesin
MTAAPSADTSALDAVRTRLAAGDLAGAAAAIASVPSSDPAGAALIDEIRRTAAGLAEATRAKAAEAGATQVTAYQDGKQKQEQAAGLTDPSQLAQAVALYQQSADAYTTAAGVGLETNRLARAAAAALRQGDTASALTQALAALRRDRRSKPALDVVAEVRTRAERDTDAARAEAVAQKAEGTGAFTEAETARAAALAMTDLTQARQQIATFDRARAQYASAVEDVAAQHAAAQHAARHAAARQALESARHALSAGDLQRAEQLLDDAVARQPDIDGAAALRADIEAARRRPAPNAAALASVNADIAKTIQAYATAYSKLDAKGVTKVAPFMAGSSERDLSATFKTLKSMTMRIQCTGASLTSGGSSALTRCTMNQVKVPKNGDVQIQRTDTADVALEKRGDRWVIVNVVSIGD